MDTRRITRRVEDLAREERGEQDNDLANVLFRADQIELEFVHLLKTRESSLGVP
jgi:hypothetical protein